MNKINQVLRFNKCQSANYDLCCQQVQQRPTFEHVSSKRNHFLRGQQLQQRPMFQQVPKRIHVLRFEQVQPSPMFNTYQSATVSLLSISSTKFDTISKCASMTTFYAVSFLNESANQKCLTQTLFGCLQRSIHKLKVHKGNQLWHYWVCKCVEEAQLERQKTKRLS